MKQTKFCDECKHGQMYAGFEGQTCGAGHRPRFYLPKSQDDETWGYKRKCADFWRREEKKGE